MKQGKSISKITVMLVIMLLCAGISEAADSFKTCYEGCALGCFLVKKDVFKCLVKCFSTCLIGSGSGSPPIVDPPPFSNPPPASDPAPAVSPSSGLTRLESCKFGCAVNHCMKFGKDVNKVADCVDSCEFGICGYLVEANEPAI